VSSVGGKSITTIEGLSPTTSHALQLAWIAEQVPQCGYCTSGWMMTSRQLHPLARRGKRSQNATSNAGRGGWLGQPIQVVEAVMKVTADLVRGPFVTELLPDRVIVVERDQLGAVHLLKEWGVLVLLQCSELLVA
jgi:hypothetical protein